MLNPKNIRYLIFLKFDQQFLFHENCKIFTQGLTTHLVTLINYISLSIQ